MGGIFGVVSSDDCINEVYYGTDYHSHLGTKFGGIVVTGENDGRLRQFLHDISNTQFRSKFDEDLSKMGSSHCAIGALSDFERQPLLVGSRLGIYAIATVGKLNNLNELAQTGIAQHQLHFSELSGDTFNPTEVVASLINSKPTIEEGIEFAFNQINGSCTLLLMINGTIYAARDKYGRTPLCIGRRPDGFCVSLESCALPNLGYAFERELGPGEIVQITRDCIVQKKKPESKMQICSFFWVYYGFPTSTYEGRNAETSRYYNGALMAKDDDVDIDTVCGIPDSGIAHAIGFANERKKPYLRALVKYTPTWARSFMPQNQTQRNLVAKMKLLPVDAQITGKKLLFCDDSIVRGTQFRDIAKKLYERGAQQVHLRSASPPIMFPCMFLNFSRSKSQLDLAARRVINALEGGEPSPEILKEYVTAGTARYNRMVDEIRKKLGLTSLKYQTIEKMVEAIGLPKDSVCTYCFDGADPHHCLDCPHHCHENVDQIH